MRLATFNTDRVGRIEGTDIVDITDLLPSADGQSIGSMRALAGRWDEVQARRLSADGPRLALDEVALSSPVPNPSKIVAAPVNYAEHKAEMNTRFQIDGLGVFLKAPSSVIGHCGTVQLPYTDRRFDHEAELAFIIGRPARHVAVKDALHHIFGYTALLDMTMRGGEDRSTRKSFDTFTPIGPWVVTADEFGSPANVDLTLAVNGTLRQQGNTADLIWDIAHLISYISSVMTLHPGDVVTTGTPAGVGPVRSGDQVHLDVGGVGRLSVAVSDAHAVACPTLGADHGPVPPKPKE